MEILDTVRAGKFTIPVVYLDNHLLGVVKPCNMPVQADASGDLDLLTALKDYIGKRFNKPGAVYLGLVHRLDRPVGGVMIFARTSKAAERLSREFSQHQNDKRYLAVVKGSLGAPRDLEDYLIKDPKNGMVSVCGADTPGAKLARLYTQPLAEREGTTLTQVCLMTGRAHQIRVQHKNAGHPLWGDNRYGGGKPGEQIALWAWQLTVTHPTLKTPLTLTAQPPEEGIWPLYQDIWEAMS